MATPSAGLGMWNWWVDAYVPAPAIHGAVAAILGRSVTALGAADPADPPVNVVLCDVWYTGGNFPTRVDCYAAPAEPSEPAAAALLARRLGHACLLPDDTREPGRHLLATPDATLRPVYVDVEQTADEEIVSGLRLCTANDAWCRHRAQCGRSRWPPGSTVPGLAAA
jgi:hypothetical protein